MSTGAAAGCRYKEAGVYRYQRRQPENNLLCRIVERYCPEFAACLAEQGMVLPQYVQRGFEACLECHRLEHGFLRVQCNHCHAEHLVPFSCLCRGFCPGCSARARRSFNTLIAATPKDLDGYRLAGLQVVLKRCNLDCRARFLIEMRKEFGSDM